MSSPRLQLEIRNLRKTYTQGHWWQRRFEIRALDGINLTLAAGKTLAIVGESGGGKTTLAMCLVGLERPDNGEIHFEGKDLAQLTKSARRHVQREIQLIFQDSTGALNPRMTAGEIVEEPLLIRGGMSSDSAGESNIAFTKTMRADMVDSVLDQVGLSPNWKARKPHEFSGGQRQRIAIARALICKPKLLILDEALTGLDLSIQGQIANLLLDLQSAHGLSYIHISHNLELVARVADEVAVLYRGKIVESGAPSEILDRRRFRTASLPTPTASKAHAAHAGGASAL